METATPLPETFAVYLAAQYIAKKGYTPGTVPEAEALHEACDIVLTKHDGYAITILCIVDCDTHPGKEFSLPADTLREIADACLKYTGTVQGQKMPATIMVLKAGAGVTTAAARERLGQYQRQGLTSKLILSACLVDTRTHEVWVNGNWFQRFGPRRFITRLLNEPRESLEQLREAGQSAVFAERGAPWVTFALLALMLAVFALEVAKSVVPTKGLLEIGVPTLFAMGGANRSLILDQGEWYRLCSAIFLHGGAIHLLFNGIAMLMAGYALEGLVGRAWYAAIFVLGGLCGSLMSLLLNAPDVVSVGASGAIMALLAAALMGSLRFPTGAERTTIQIRLMQLLIPALLPLTAGRGGPHIDIGAHVGGAIGGAVLGWFLLRNWPKQEPLPHFGRIAAAIAAAGFAVFAWSAWPISQHYQEYAEAASLMPDEEKPKTDADMLARADELVQRYPADPRVHLFRALNLLRQHQPEPAEAELRMALSKKTILQTQFTPELTQRLQGLLALTLLSEGRDSEARAEAAQACAAMASADGASEVNDMLRQNHLCEKQ